MILKGSFGMGDSPSDRINYESIENLFDEQEEESEKSEDTSTSNRVGYDSNIEDLFDEQAEESDELEDISISSCVYEPVLVGVKEEKLESRLEKSFYPQYDREITVIDADGNALIHPIEDLHFFAFVNIPLQIDLLNINNFDEIVETFAGDSFKVRSPSGQNFDTGFFGLVTNPEDRYKYIFFPFDNIRIQYQQRPIGDIFVEKNFLSEDILQNVLRKQKQLRNLRLGSIIAKRTNLQPQHVEKTLQKAWQKSPDKKLQLEEERLKKETNEKLRQEQERLRKEADKKLRLEEERLKKETDKKLHQEQERLRIEVEEKKRLEEKRLMKETDEKLYQEQKRLQKETDEKLRRVEKLLKKEADEELHQVQKRLQIEADQKQWLEEERLQKEVNEKLLQEQERLQLEAEEKKRLEEERLKKEADKKLHQEQERLRKLAEKKLQLEAEWLKKETEEKRPTGDILIEAGLVSSQAVKQSLAIQKKMRHMKVGELFVEMGYINEDQMYKVLAEKFKKRFVSLQKTTPTDEALSCLSREVIKKLEIIPIHFQNERLVIATSNPNSANLSRYSARKTFLSFRIGDFSTQSNN
jgi:hypothetical protein